MSNIRVSGIVEESIVDGPGLRYVVFTQGCCHACPGCHNPHTHALDGGYWLDTETMLRQIAENPLLAGVTFSGGEPFLQPEPLAVLAKAVHALGKNVITYTGFTFEQLWEQQAQNPHVAALLEQSDLLIDGPYIECMRDLELDFRGSSNQRILTRDDRKRLCS